VLVLMETFHQILLNDFSMQMSPKPSIMAEKPRSRQRTVFAKNLGVGVGFGYRNNTRERGIPSPIVKYGDSAVTCAKMAEPLEMLFGLWARMGPRNCDRWGFRGAEGCCHGNQFWDAICYN